MSGYDLCLSTCYYCCELEDNDLYWNCSCCVKNDKYNQHKWYYCCFNVHGCDFLKWSHKECRGCLICSFVLTLLAFICRVILTIILLLCIIVGVVICLPIIVITCPLWFPFAIIIMFFSWMLSIMYGNRDGDILCCCKFLCMMLGTRKSSTMSQIV